MNTICSRSSWSRIDSAIARWPTWMGSNVPPNSPMRSRHRRLPELGLPFELDRPDPHRVARPDARAPQLGVDPQAREVPLEPLGRLFVVEVGLGRQPLDPAAAHPERPVDVLAHVERVAGALEAVDDDARGLGRRRRARRRTAAARRARRRTAGTPSPVGGRDRQRRPCPPPRARRGTPAIARGASSTSILLNATSVGFSSSAGSCASSSSRRTP